MVNRYKAPDRAIVIGLMDAVERGNATQRVSRANSASPWFWSPTSSAPPRGGDVPRSVVREGPFSKLFNLCERTTDSERVDSARSPGPQGPGRAER